jgi:PAS domain S-box-containing protein
MPPVSEHTIRKEGVTPDSHKHPEDALHFQPEWCRITLASIGDAVITTDSDGRVTFLNSVAESLTGWTLEEAAGQPLDSVVRLINEESRQPVESPTVRALRDGVVVGLANHTLLIAEDGMEGPIDDSASPIRNDKGEVAGVVLVFRDISERRRHERHIQDALTYADNIIATMREPFVVLDKSLRVQTANASFYRNFHVSKEETEGRFIYDLGNGQWDIPRLRTFLEEVLPQNQSFQDYDVEHDFPTIGRKIMLLNARRFVSEGSRSELILLAIEDITERKRAEETLLEAGALQSAIFNSANFSSIATDEKGVIQIFNVGAERMLGYTAAEVMNKITPADISDPQEVIARAAALSLELATPITPGFAALVFKASRGIEDIYELTYIRKDGSRFPAVVSVTALRDDQSAIIGYLLIGTDNTARKQAEEALLKAGALQNAIFTSANFSSIATDEKGVIQIFNVGAERMLGYAAAEVMNKITPADISDPQEVITRAKALSAELGTTITPGFAALVFKAARGIEDIYELTYIRKDGSRFPAIVSVTALRDAQGGIIGYLLIGTDNTARKQVEAERMVLDQRVRDQQFYTRSLVESNIDALIATDPRGIITDVNKQMKALTGCTRDELIGSPFKDYFTDPEQAEAGIKRVLVEGKVTDYELTARARDGKETVVSYNATTFHDRDRKLQGVFAAARDVTDRSLLEKLLRGQAAKLSDVHRRKDEFLAMLGHELRNPLAPILNAVQLLRLQRGESGPQQQARAIIERQVGQLVHLVDDLLEVSRIATGTIHLQQEPLDMRAIVECGVETVRPLIEQRRHALDVRLPPSPIWIDGDSTRLEQVVVNLLNNAAKYTDEGGHIWLSLQQEGNEAVLKVRDSGVGIAPELMPRIFDLFTQAERSLARSQGGLGIGLALVQRLVEMHGGKVAAHSSLGRGSEFVVRLPVVLISAPQPPPATETGQPTARPLRVLVVDDNVDTAGSLAMLLQAVGHDVRTAHDGPQALKAALDYRPNVVLLDIGLPGLNGYEVAKQIRQDPVLQNVVLVAMTGYGQETDRQCSQEAGFDHHLVKPARFEEIQKILVNVASKAI